MGITKKEKLRRDKLAEQGIKVCRICKEEKPFNEFSKNKRSAYGFNNECKSCFRQYQKQYLEENKERVRESKKQYYQENKEQQKERARQYRQENKELIRERKKQYHKENKERIRESRKRYRQENKELIRERKKQYYQENREVILEQKKQYSQKPEVKARVNKWYRERLQSDPMFKARKNLSISLWKGFKRKGWRKDSSTQEVIGCAWEQLMLWLGDEPSKENHIDHVIPISLAETPEELKLLNHYTNFQLLPAEENLSKKNRYIRKHNLKRVIAHHPQPDKLKEIVERSDVEII
jgi:hypothetical protein